MVSQELGVPEVQIQEPILTLTDTASLEADFQATYAAFAAVGLPINLVALYDDIGDAFKWATKLPVQVTHTCSPSNHGPPCPKVDHYLTGIRPGHHSTW